MNKLGKDLRQLVGNNIVKTDPADLLVYEADANHYFAKGKPDAVVLPGSKEDVSKVLKYAAGVGIPVTPRGAGTGLSGGCTPMLGGIVLDMKRMNRILDINPGNFNAVAECGVVLERFQRTVENQNMFYPPDPQSKSVCTLGGNVSTGAGGPYGVKYGTTKNYVLGLEVVLPDGEIIRTGSNCTKNSTGYDFTHLMTGAEGTLGVVTEVITRLIPLPATNRTVIVSCDSPEMASKMVSAIIAAGTLPAMLEYVPGISIGIVNQYISNPLNTEIEACLFIKLDGFESQVEEEAKQIEEACSEMGAIEIRIVEDRKEAENYWTARASGYGAALKLCKKIIAEDVTVPRDRLPEFIRTMGDLSAKLGIIVTNSGHAGDGNAHPGILLTELNEETEQKAQEAIREIIRTGLALGGCISGEHGIGIHKAEFLEDQLGKRQIELMKAVKKAFDPHTIMNPGKIWIEGDAL